MRTYPEPDALRERTKLPLTGPMRLGERDHVPPRVRTPGQAEGEDDNAEREERSPGEVEPTRERQPDQAEGEDREDKADRVPHKE
jgi:hypothetical protein